MLKKTYYILIILLIAFNLHALEQQKALSHTCRGRFDNRIDDGNSEKFKVVSIRAGRIDINDDHLIIDRKTQYAVAGFDNAQAIESTAQQFKQAVLNKDKGKVAELISYPINVRVKGKITKIKNIKQFIKLYDLIFYPDFVEKIRNSVPHNMFAKWEGVMLGDKGEIWFNNIHDMDEKGEFKIKITAINNDVDYTVVLMSELDKGLQKGKIYCKNTATGLQYVVMDLNGRRVDGFIEKFYIQPLTINNLNARKADILTETSKRGHTEELVSEKAKYYIKPDPISSK